MKKVALGILAMVLCGFAAFIALGFVPKTDVFLSDFAVSQDGSQIEMQVGVASSMGYTRGFRSKQGGFNEYLTFYSAFGGFNSSVCAKNRFVLEIDSQNCDEIYFYHGGGGYKLVLQKNPQSGEWERP